MSHLMTIDYSEWEKGFKKYLLTTARHSTKSTAVNADKSRFKFLCNYFKDKDFNSINFQKLIDEMSEPTPERPNGYSPAYKNNIYRCALSYTKYLKFTGRKSIELEFEYFKDPKKVNLNILKPEDVEALANVNVNYRINRDFLNKRNKAFILLVGGMGCRPDEALSLNWSDISVEDKVLVFRDTKSNEDRAIPIPTKIVEALLDIPRRNDLVFYSARTGKKLNTQEINLDLKVRAKLIGLTKRVDNKFFRESFISSMIYEGASWFELSKIVGHKNPETTMRYYHSLPERLREVMRSHPFFKDDLDFKTKSDIVEKDIKKYFDIKEMTIKTSEGKNQIVFVLE